MCFLQAVTFVSRITRRDAVKERKNGRRIRSWLPRMTSVQSADIFQRIALEGLRKELDRRMPQAGDAANSGTRVARRHPFPKQDCQRVRTVGRGHTRAEVLTPLGITRFRSRITLCCGKTNRGLGQEVAMPLLAAVPVNRFARPAQGSGTAGTKSRPTVSGCARAHANLG
jgi:hypothetical protein